MSFIVMKFQKIGDAKYISHIDLLKTMTRTFRRADFEIAFSKGFNPHQNIYFSPPIALGISSIAEYVVVEMEEKADKISADEFLKRYNKTAVRGLEGLEAYESFENPNFAGKVKSFQYEIEVIGSEAEISEIENLKNRESYVVSWEAQGVEKSKDALPLIIDIKLIKKQGEDGQNSAEKAVKNTQKTSKSMENAAKNAKKVVAKFMCELAAGGESMRPDRLAAQLEKDFAVEIPLAGILKVGQTVKGK